MAKMPSTNLCVKLQINIENYPNSSKKHFCNYKRIT